MDNKKLIAARKRLKEYQKSKKEQSQENHSSQGNNATKQKKKPVNDNYNAVPSQNKNYLQQNMKQNSTENSLPDTDNSINLNTENNYQNSTDDNNAFHITECQISHNQESFNQMNHEKVAEFVEGKVENNFGAPSLNFDSEQRDRQMHATFTSIKDSYTYQKEQMMQMSSAIQDALKDKCENDGFYRQTETVNVAEDNKVLVDNLQKQVLQSENRIHELEKMLKRKHMEFEALMQDNKTLQESIPIHAHTTNILVAEKAELCSALDKNQLILQQKTDEARELSEKLKTSHLRISELEKELLFIRSNNNDVHKACQQMQKRFDELSNQFLELRKTKEDLELESSELKQKLNVKNSELANLQQEFQEKAALLSLSELKIQQLTNSPQETQMIDNQRNAVAIYEQQIAQLKETIKNLTDEKCDAGKQYKTYVQQLDERHVQLTNELETANKRIVEFETREESYIQRLSDMEQHLQKEKNKIESLAPVEEHQTRINILTKNIDNLVLEQESLQTVLTNKDTEIEQLKHQLQELQEAKEQEVDTSKLLSALESEQQGAARAVSQNQQLKNQLNEMHDAFVSLSNDKLDLTEQLQAERSIGKKLNIMLNDVEIQLDEVKAQLSEKEAALMEFEKDKLRSAQIEDQIQHYQAQSHHASTLQQELTKALSTIEMLKKDNQRLNEKINIQSRTMISLEESPKNSQPLSNSNSNIPEVHNVEVDNTDSNEIKSRKVSTETQTSTQAEEDESFNIPEPLQKLEVKFVRTMEQVAELTDEKQRLEHLVMQLQGETETIGEYIALYQKQRSILHEKSREREKTYKALVEQRNQLQEQLHKLKVLVADLIRNKLKCSLDDQSSVNNNDNNIQERVDITNVQSNIIEPSVVEPTPIIDVKDKTTSEIMDLLSEIKDCNDTCILEPDFHPCPWCSGKLITV